MSFLEKYKSKNAPEKAAPKRMSKSKEWFAPITVSRVEKLNGLSGRLLDAFYRSCFSRTSIPGANHSPCRTIPPT